MRNSYSLIVVGTGPASCFFLHRYLRSAGADAKVLLLERGQYRDHQWQLKNKGALLKAGEKTFINITPKVKTWAFSAGVGGSSNCWVGCTPRLLPEDFTLQTLYGVGVDWPVQYADLEPFYAEAEAVMAISGPDNTALFPRSTPYPQPPHQMQVPEEVLAKAYPGLFFPMPTARARVFTSQRTACCSNSVCKLCPVDAKFTVLNGMQHVLRDPRVQLLTGARVDVVDVGAGIAKGVTYFHEGKHVQATADLVVLGANGIHNPALLLRSGLRQGPVGEGLVEQSGVHVVATLDGMDGFQGSTYLTGHGYMLYGGEHRRSLAAGLIETSNKPTLRQERGRWRQILRMLVIFEDFRRPENRVTALDNPDKKAQTEFRARSEHTERAIRSLPKRLEKVLAPLPVQTLTVERTARKSEAHILGTTVMGRDPTTSVVDDKLVHHRVRNLVVLGSGAFPTAAPANPTLTLAALSLWSAHRLFS